MVTCVPRAARRGVEVHPSERCQRVVREPCASAGDIVESAPARLAGCARASQERVETIETLIVPGSARRAKHAGSRRTANVRRGWPCHDVLPFVTILMALDMAGIRGSLARATAT